jgi:hypothetical protein
MKGKENGERKNEIEKYMLRIENTVKKKRKLKSVSLVLERTTPAERPPHIGEGSASFCG